MAAENDSSRKMLVPLQINDFDLVNDLQFVFGECQLFIGLRD